MTLRKIRVLVAKTVPQKGENVPFNGPAQLESADTRSSQLAEHLAPRQVTAVAHCKYNSSLTLGLTPCLSFCLWYMRTRNSRSLPSMQWAGLRCGKSQCLTKTYLIKAVSQPLPLMTLKPSTIAQHVNVFHFHSASSPAPSNTCHRGARGSAYPHKPESALIQGECAHQFELLAR